MGLEAAARAVNVRDVMISRFESLPATATLDGAAQALLRTTQHEFPIVDGGGRLRGVLTRTGLVAGLQQRGGQTPVIEAMAANIPVVRDHEKLIKALEHLKKGAARAVGVVDAGGRLVGYVIIENNRRAHAAAQRRRKLTDLGRAGPWICGPGTRCCRRELQYGGQFRRGRNLSVRS